MMSRSPQSSVWAHCPAELRTLLSPVLFHLRPLVVFFSRSSTLPVSANPTSLSQVHVKATPHSVNIFPHPFPLPSGGSNRSHIEYIEYLMAPPFLLYFYCHLPGTIHDFCECLVSLGRLGSPHCRERDDFQVFILMSRLLFSYWMN